MKQLLLASPCNPSSFLGENVKIQGVLQGIKNPTGVFSLLINQRQHSVVTPRIIARDSDLLIEIIQNFSELVPNTHLERQNYSLQLRYKDDDVELLSPSSTITFQEQATWNEPLGGYVYPDTNSIQVRGRYFVVEGWAAKMGSIQKEVNIWVNDKRIPCPNINIWSPLVGSGLPSLEHAMKAHFSVVLECPRFYFSAKKRRKLYAEIIFKDESQLKLPTKEVIWLKPLRRIQLPQNRGNGILFLANNLRATEGAPRVLFEIIKVAISLGQKVGVISPIGGELESSLKELGVETYIVPDLYLAHYSRLDNFKRQTAKAISIIDEFNPSLVFGNTIEAFWGISHAQSIGAKTMWLIHESINPQTVFNELDPRARMLFLEALDKAKNIFVSEATRDLFKAKGRSTKVIPNGVRPLDISSERKNQLRKETRERLNIPESCLLLLNVGTICERKGQDFLLNVLTEISDLDFRVLLVGARKSDFLNHLKNQINSLGLGSKVILQEETREVEQFYAAADLFAISSREESAPLVSLEALNWSLPIVSTDAFGLVEQLKRSDAALLSPVGDVKAYACNLRKMITDQKLRDISAKNGKLWVNKTFNLDITLKLYEGLLKRYL